jgi:hypothetical protein
MLARSRQSRKSTRRWMRRNAQVMFEGYEQFIGSVVHHISNGGACLSFTGPLDALDSVQRDCELVWSGRGVVGVTFISRWFGAKASECETAFENPHLRGSREPKSIA